MTGVVTTSLIALSPSLPSRQITLLLTGLEATIRGTHHHALGTPTLAGRQVLSDCQGLGEGREQDRRGPEPQREEVTAD